MEPPSPGAVCLNGRFMAPEQAVVSPFDFGFLYGDGVFETLRTYGGVPFRLEAHLARLQDAVEALAIHGVPPAAVLREWVAGALERAALPEALVRVTVTRGVGTRGLDPAGCGAPTVFVAALPLRALAASPDVGITAAILWPRHTGESPSPAIKSTSYQRSVLARVQLARQGVQEGFFLDQDGNVTEGTTSNVFALRAGELHTPPPERVPARHHPEGGDLARGRGGRPRARGAAAPGRPARRGRALHHQLPAGGEARGPGGRHADRERRSRAGDAEAAPPLPGAHAAGRAGTVK